MNRADKILGGFGFVERTEQEDGSYTETYGIMLRDYLATAAMQGILTRINPNSAHELAEFSYSYADAMLAEREKSK